MSERRRISWKPFVALAVAIAAVNAVGLELRTESKGPSGPDHSAFATTPQGLAAYADLLRAHGHHVARVVERPAGVRLEPRDVAYVLDPDFVTDRDRGALARFVRAGGRLVVAVDRDAVWLRTLLAPTAGPRLALLGVIGTGRPLAPVPEVAHVRRVEFAGEGAWETTGSALPVVGFRDNSQLAVATIGRGRVILLADPSPLENRLLARADDAVLGLDLAGAGSRPVVFVEGIHGFGRATGLSAIPASWWVVLSGLALAALLYAAARARRLGPPERAERELPPPRAAYVSALGARLAAAKDSDATFATLRRELDRRVGPKMDDEDARGRALVGFGVTADDLRLMGSSDRQAELALGRAVVAVYAAQTPLGPDDNEEARP